MMSEFSFRLWRQYSQSPLADYVPAVAVMFGGLWVTALLMGI